MCNSLDTYRRVTDGQTSCYCIVRAMHTRRAVKKCILAISVKGGRGIRATLHCDFNARRRTGVARSDGMDGQLP